MTVDRAAPTERLTAPLWLAAIAFILGVGTVVSWMVLGMLMEPMRRSFAWIPAVLLPAPIVVAGIGLRYFCGHLYRREGEMLPGLAAHLRHCALLYTGLALVIWGWSACVATRCADDFGAGFAASALLLLGVGADAWALVQWRRADHAGVTVSRGAGAPLPNDR